MGKGDLAMQPSRKLRGVEEKSALKHRATSPS